MRKTMISLFSSQRSNKDIKIRWQKHNGNEQQRKTPSNNNNNNNNDNDNNLFISSAHLYMTQ